MKSNPECCSLPNNTGAENLFHRELPFSVGRFNRKRQEEYGSRKEKYRNEV